MLVGSGELCCRRARNSVKPLIAGLERVELLLKITLTLKEGVRGDTALLHAVYTYREGVADSDKVEEGNLQRNEEVPVAALHGRPQVIDLRVNDSLG